jgi:biopolymer transport protein ExbD
MLRRKHKRQQTDLVEPDLPITPMLDMSFQLLAFFIITFKPTPTEGQIALALPKDSGGPAAMSSPSPIDENQPRHFIVQVEATEPGGGIKNMTISEEGSPNPPKDLKATVENYRDELKAISAQLEREKKTGKLTLECGGKLLHAYVVQLMDTAVRSGFNDISPVPLDKSKR